MENLITNGAWFDRRQEVPPVYRINGSLYLWRAAFVRTQERSWRQAGRYLMHEIPEMRAMSIDTASQFAQAEHLLTGGVIQFPWLDNRVIKPHAVAT